MAQRALIRITEDPARRLWLFWRSLAWLVTGLYFAISLGYLVAGSDAILSSALTEVAAVEGNLHVHGFIMLGISAMMLYGLSQYRQFTRIALYVSFAYANLVMILIFAGWPRVGISWGAPWWYVFLAGCSFLLIIFAPRPEPRSHAGGLEGRGSA